MELALHMKTDVNAENFTAERYRLTQRVSMAHHRLEAHHAGNCIFKGRSPEVARGLYKALDYDDRMVFEGPARRIVKLDAERAEYAREFADSVTIRAADMVEVNGEMVAPDTMPESLIHATANLPPAPAPPAPTFGNSAVASAPALASRSAESAGQSAASGSVLVSRSAESTDPDVPPPPPRPFLPVVGGGGLLSEVEEAGERVNTFYRCPNKDCGFYGSSQLWQPGFAGGKPVWYCGINWPAFQVLFPEAYGRVLAQFGSGEKCNWAFCCAQKYRPWAKGSASIIEFKRPSTGEWACIVAEVMPPALQQAIASVKKSFYEGMDSALAEDVMGVCPVVIPKVNLVALPGGGTLPGIGKLDMAAYTRANNPIMDAEGWWRFARAIAEQNMEVLRPVFDKTSAALGVMSVPAPLEPMVELSREEEEAFWG